MSPQTEFEATINSLGEHLVGYIGKDILDSLSVVGDEDTLETSAVIVPVEHSAEIYDRIISAVVEVRGMFMTDVRLEYVIANSKGAHETHSESRAVFAAA